MNAILMILCVSLLLVLPVLLIIGLVKPKLILIWSKKPGRWKVFGWWILCSFLHLFAISFLTDNRMPLPKINEKTGKWGYTQYAKNVIEYKFDDADHFSFGLARVNINGRWGYINNQGEEIIPPQYDLSEKFFREHFHEADNLFAMVGINGKWGMINPKGTEIIPLLYDSIKMITAGRVNVYLNGKYGYGTYTADEGIISPLYDNISFLPNSNGIAKVKSDSKYGLINNTGIEIVPALYDSINVFQDGMAKVLKNNKYGYINYEEGKKIIPAQYDYIGNFQYNLAPVKLNGKYGYINKEGKIVVPFQFNEADDFRRNQGFANVKLADSEGRVDTLGVFTKQSQTISLIEAVRKKYVHFSASGKGIQSSHITIENLTDWDLNLTIPAGTFLNANSSSDQNMVLTNPQDIKVNAKRTYSSNVSTACMNIHRNIPGGNSTFGISMRPNSHLLSKVIKLLNDGNYSYNIIQAAVWIVTDNASYGNVGILRNQYGGSIIDYDDYQKAASIVNEARKLKL